MTLTIPTPAQHLAARLLGRRVTITAGRLRIAAYVWRGRTYLV